MQEFEGILDKTCETLRNEARLKKFESSKAFELRVAASRELLKF